MAVFSWIYRNYNTGSRKNNRIDHLTWTRPKISACWTQIEQIQVDMSYIIVDLHRPVKSHAFGVRLTPWSHLSRPHAYLQNITVFGQNLTLSHATRKIILTQNAVGAYRVFLWWRVSDPRKMHHQVGFIHSWIIMKLNNSSLQQALHSTLLQCSRTLYAWIIESGSFIHE